MEELWEEQSKELLLLPKYKNIGRPSNKNLNQVIEQKTRLTLLLENDKYLHELANSNSNPK